MNEIKALKRISNEIEYLTKMHIIYGLENSSRFEKQKNDIARLIRDFSVDPNKDFDPVTRNLYRRYFC